MAIIKIKKEKEPKVRKKKIKSFFKLEKSIIKKNQKKEKNKKKTERINMSVRGSLKRLKEELNDENSKKEIDKILTLERIHIVIMQDDQSPHNPLKRILCKTVNITKKDRETLTKIISNRLNDTIREFEMNESFELFL